MELDSFDMVASLQALPETDPIEVDGIQFGGHRGGHRTCQVQCVLLSVQILNTVCAIFASC